MWMILLIYSEDPKEGRKVFDDIQKRYKLKLTGELLEDSPREVSFLGRRIFRRRGGERRVYFGLAENYLDSCCEEFGITKPSPKLVSLEKRYAELLKKGLTEAISPAAHERYRRTPGSPSVGCPLETRPSVCLWVLGTTPSRSQRGSRELHEGRSSVGERVAA